jgi:hypothetical protein
MRMPFAVEQERVEISNLNILAGEDLDGIGGTAGLVVEFHGKDVRLGHGHPGILEHLVSAWRFATDETADAVVHGVGDGGSDELNVGLV